MFHTRITETWGAPVVVGDRYLLERLVEHPSDDRIVCARERDTGIRRWVKFAATPEQESSLLNELAVLRIASHQVIAALAAANQAGEPGWYAVEWQGEVPLDDEHLHRLPAIDRLRIANLLVNLVEYLIGLRVALPSLCLEQLWVTPALHNLRLVGLPGVQTNAQADAIGRMREAAARILDVLIPSETPGAPDIILKPLIANWGDGGQAAGQLVSGFERALMQAVTADLAHNG